MTHSEENSKTFDELEKDKWNRLDRLERDPDYDSHMVWMCGGVLCVLVGVEVVDCVRESWDVHGHNDDVHHPMPLPPHAQGILRDPISRKVLKVAQGT